MPTNFRLAYNSDGLNYVDLFPKTSMDAIIGADNTYEVTELQVTIPVPDTSILNQTITISTTPKMVSSLFRMYLVSTGNQAQNDYNTTTQAQVETNQVIITRAYDMPINSIIVMLVFFEKRGSI